MFNDLKPASISVNIYGSCIYSQKRYNTTVCYNVWYVLRIMYVTYSMLCSMLYYAQKHWYSQTDDGKTCVNHFSIDSVWNWIFCHSISFSLYLNLSIPQSEASAHSYKLAKDIGRRLMFQRLWVWIPALYTGWTFLLVWKDKKLTKKRPWMAYFYKLAKYINTSLSIQI